MKKANIIILSAIFFLVLFTNAVKCPWETDDSPVAIAIISPETGIGLFAFDGSDSYDDNDELEDLEFTWTLDKKINHPDGDYYDLYIRKTEISFELNLTTSAEYLVTLIVKDSEGNAGYDEKTIKVTGSQLITTRLSVEPHQGFQNLTSFHFDASNSEYEPDLNYKLWFRWKFGADASWGEWEEDNSIVDRTFSEPGNINVFVEARHTVSNENITGDANVIIEVLDQSDACGGKTEIEYEDKTYSIGAIGDQCWFLENLNIGNPIPIETDQTDNGTIEKYCYNNEAANCAIYGGLYKWGEMLQYSVDITKARGICPEGWHIPDDLFDFADLEIFLGYAENAGGKMKSLDHWITPNTGATNESGFTALPGGIAKFNDEPLFSKLGEECHFWVSEWGLQGVYGDGKMLSFDSKELMNGGGHLNLALSIRCVMD